MSSPVCASSFALPADVVTYGVCAMLGFRDVLSLAQVDRVHAAATREHWRVTLRSQQLTRFEAAWFRGRGNLPPTQWVASLKLRYCAQSTLQRRLMVDARLTRAQRRALQATALRWNGASRACRRALEAYVYGMLAFKPVLRADHRRLRHLFELGHARFSFLGVLREYRLQVRTDPDYQVGVWRIHPAPRPPSFVGCFDEKDRLWPTCQWTHEVEHWTRRICETESRRAMGRWCDQCPVCGQGNDAAAWSLKCSLAYAAWTPGGGLLRALDRVDYKLHRTVKLY